MFSIVENRPDIVFTTSVVSRFAKNPSRQHIEAVKTILQYLKVMKTLSIMFGKEESSDQIIKDYLDSD